MSAHSHDIVVIGSVVINLEHFVSLEPEFNENGIMIGAEMYFSDGHSLDIEGTEQAEWIINYFRETHGEQRPERIPSPQVAPLTVSEQEQQPQK